MTHDTPKFFTTYGNVTPLNAAASGAVVNENLVEHLKTMLVLAETGQLKWAFAVGQTDNHQVALGMDSAPVSADKAYKMVHAIHEYLILKLEA